MQLGIFAKTFEGTHPLQVLSAAKSAGYETVQYNFSCSGLGALPSKIERSKFDEVREAVKQTGVTITALSATYNMVDPDHEKRLAGRRSFNAIAKAAAALGVKIVTVCTGSCDPGDQWRHHPDNEGAAAWEEMVNEFEQILPVAEQADVVIGIEPELANVVSSASKARFLLDHFSSRHLGIVFDAANIAEPVSDSIALVKGHIVLAHAKDRTADHRFAAAGKGALDWSDYISCLKNSGFNGALVTHGLSAAEAPDVAKFLKGLL